MTYVLRYVRPSKDSLAHSPYSPPFDDAIVNSEQLPRAGDYLLHNNFQYRVESVWHIIDSTNGRGVPSRPIVKVKEG